MYQLVERTRVVLETQGTLDTLSIPDRVEALERVLIGRALRMHGGNKVAASKTLGITRQGLHKKLKRYKISVERVIEVEQGARDGRE